MLLKENIFIFLNKFLNKFTDQNVLIYPLKNVSNYKTRGISSVTAQWTFGEGGDGIIP